MKKILSFIRFIIISIIWSYLYLWGTWVLIKSVWGFNYLSRTSWDLISNFWNLGGKIKTANDYTFVMVLILLIPIWLIGWRKACKISYINVLLSPILWYQKRSADKYIKNASRTKIKNIGISVGEEIKQDFENKLKAKQEAVQNSVKSSRNIRSSLQQKLGNKQ